MNKDAKQALDECHCDLHSRSEMDAWESLLSQSSAEASVAPELIGGEYTARISGIANCTSYLNAISFTLLPPLQEAEHIKLMVNHDGMTLQEYGQITVTTPGTHVIEFNLFNTLTSKLQRDTVV